MKLMKSRDWLTVYETRLNSKLKFLRTDNGLKYFS